MQKIDFLPQRYRERSAERRQMFCRLAVAASFFVLLSVVFVRQIALQHGAQRSIDELADAVVQAEQVRTKLAAIESELALEAWRARLYAYLQHPWPRTNLVEAVAQDVPEEIDLAELQVALQEPGGSRKRRFREVFPQGQATTNAASNTASVWERDLEKMRAEYDALRTVVMMSGVTRDTDVLHSFLARLARSSYFSNAELVSLESTSLRTSGASQFTIRLTVRPGYGQPSGPENDAASVAMLQQTAGGVAP